MPSQLAPGSRVLVTGVTGFIGAHLAEQLLKSGYIVKGTSRGGAKANHLRNYFSQYRTKFEIVEIADMQKDGAYDEAVKGKCNFSTLPIAIRCGCHLSPGYRHKFRCPRSLQGFHQSCCCSQVKGFLPCARVV